MGAYREATQAYQQRHATLAARASRLSSRLTGDLARLFPARSKQLKHFASAAVPRGNEPGEWQRACQAAERQVEALEQLIAEAPQLQQQCNEPDGEIPAEQADACQLPGWDHFWGAADAEHQQSMQRLCLAVDPAARVIAAEAPQRCCRQESVFEVHFRAQGAPFSAQVASVSREAEALVGPTVRMLTTVARAAPELRLRPEMLRHSLLLKPLGLVRDVEVGQFNFDGTFLIDASPQAARQLLTPRVRKGLLDVAHYEVPELCVANGVAALRWCYEPNEPSFTGALEALQGLREAQVSAALLRPGDDPDDSPVSGP